MNCHHSTIHSCSVLWQQAYTATVNTQQKPQSKLKRQFSGYKKKTFKIHLIGANCQGDYIYPWRSSSPQLGLGSPFLLFPKITPRWPLFPVIYICTTRTLLLFLTFVVLTNSILWLIKPTPIMKGRTLNCKVYRYRVIVLLTDMVLPVSRRGTLCRYINSWTKRSNSISSSTDHQLVNLIHF